MRSKWEDCPSLTLQMFSAIYLLIYFLIPDSQH